VSSTAIENRGLCDQCVTSCSCYCSRLLAVSLHFEEAVSHVSLEFGAGVVEDVVVTGYALGHRSGEHDLEERCRFLWIHLLKTPCSIPERIVGRYVF